jgi:hypothetical protein
MDVRRLNPHDPDGFRDIRTIQRMARCPARDKHTRTIHGMGATIMTGTLTLAKHGYTCRQTTTLGHDGDGRLSSHVRLAAQHVDADGNTRKGCGVDTTDYPRFVAHMRDAHGVKAARQSKTFGAPYAAGTNGFKPVRLTQLEKEWLGHDVMWEDEPGVTSSEVHGGQVWALSGTGSVWVACDDLEYRSVPVSHLLDMTPATVDVELPIAA